MKYNININQRAIIEHGVQIDMIDAAIIDFVVGWANCAESIKIFSNGIVFTWIGYELILSQMPMLGTWKNGELIPMKKDTVYRRMKNLCKIGLLELHEDSKIMGRSFYAISDKVSKLSFGNKSETSEINPNPIGLESDDHRKNIRTPSEKYPNYNNIEYNKINNNIIEEKEEEQKRVLPTPPEDVIEEDVILTPPKPKTKKKEKIKLIWPASFTPKVIKGMEEYIQMRQQVGKAVKSQIAFSRLCNDCEKILTDYGEETLIYSIGIATTSQWQAIYAKQPPTNNNHGTNNTQNTKTTNPFNIGSGIGNVDPYLGF